MFHYEETALQEAEPKRRRRLCGAMIVTSNAPAVASQHCERCYCDLSDSDKAMRFCGSMRMMPPRGLSMSAIRKKAIVRIVGNMTRVDCDVRRSLKPSRKLQTTATSIMSTHAPTGTRFHQAACV